MADLNYNDVQRAVQDGIRPLQNELQRIQQATERIDDIEAVVRELQQSLHGVQASVLAINHSTTSAVDPRLTQLVNEVNDLRSRFATIEKFATQMSEYFRAKYDEEQEDRQYRAV